MITPNSAPTPHQENLVRRSGAALGIIVFLVGVALVGYVFVKAMALFAEPLPTLPVATLTPVATPSPAAGAPSPEATNAATAIGTIAMDFGRQVLFLLLMCIAGSVIASRGVDMFFKACAAAPPVVRSGAAPAAGAAAPAQNQTQQP